MYQCTSRIHSWFLFLKSCTIPLLPVTVVPLLRCTVSEEMFQNVSLCTACFLHQNPAFMLLAVPCRQQLMTMKELHHILLHGQKTSAVWKKITQRHSGNNADVFKGVLYPSWTQVPLCDRSLKASSTTETKFYRLYNMLRHLKWDVSKNLKLKFSGPSHNTSSNPLEIQCPSLHSGPSTVTMCPCTSCNTPWIKSMYL